MAHIALNKSSLAKQREQLKLYGKLLPSLDLKRQQLTGELARSRKQFERAVRERERGEDEAAAQLPMLANEKIPTDGLVHVRRVDLTEENIVGVRVPALDRIEFERAPYSLLARPHWIDPLVERLEHSAKQRVEVAIAVERVRLLEQALRKVTQRVNLFEKVMIPRAKQNIKRIQIYLGDAERSAVVRSKLAKQRRVQARQAGLL